MDRNEGNIIHGLRQISRELQTVTRSDYVARTMGRYTTANID